MKTATQAAANYGANGGSLNAANNWANNFTANITAILSAAIAAIPRWQAAVATDQAAINMNNGLTRAKSDIAAITTKVTTVGKASFSAGVKAAALPGGDYVAFIGPWLSKVAAAVSTLPPRGDPDQNTARMDAYNTWAKTQHGLNRVK